MSQVAAAREGARRVRSERREPRRERQPGSVTNGGTSTGHFAPCHQYLGAFGLG